MTASERRLEVITSNLANAQTTAFKRLAAVHHVRAGAGPREADAQVATATRRDWSQGPLERTGVPTDLALVGRGFFAVEGPDGEQYTRDGRFSLTDRGALVTRDGYPVAWDGARGTLDPTGEAVSVDGSGQVHQGEAPVGRLRLVDFDALELLEESGDGYFRAAPELSRNEAAAEVHQGALEGSNVSTVDELVALIQNQRAFEASAKVTSMIAETYQRLNRFR